MQKHWNSEETLAAAQQRPTERGHTTGKNNRQTIKTMTMKGLIKMFVDDYRKEGFTKEEWTWGLIGSAVFMAVMVLAGGL